MSRAAKALTTVVLASVSLAAQPSASAPLTLPEPAAVKLVESLKAAASHATHAWRDVPPVAGELVNGYVEIPMGERNKHEFDMLRNALSLDRVIPEHIGGYPVNYGFVPQTVSYDGDPFDVLVLGPPIPGGRTVQGVVVGLMQMEDEKGLDSKVVISPAGEDGKPLHQLTEADQERIAIFFRNYKKNDPSTWSKVPGWGSAADAWTYVQTTHAFFRQCRIRPGPCEIARPY